MAEKFFPYRIDERWSRMARVFGFRPGVDGVTVDDDTFVATYGGKRVEVPRAGIDGAHITRDYTWYKAVGTRLSLVDDGLTFGTCTEGGVCVHFAPRIPKVIGFRDHSALTVTVEDLEGLVAELDPPG